VEPISATDVPWSEIQAVLDSPVGGADRQVRVVDIGPHNVAIGVLHRNATVDRGGPVRGIVHTHVAEVYYVISGSGTLVTGGELSNQSAPMSGQIVAEVVGPSFTAESTGGVSRIVSVGDVIVIPAGVFHGWPSVPDHVTYLSVRPDPDRVLPAGFVNPVIE
jgi:mannose-6-phosphate isomerase-like protein (cupin superfamily)